MINVLHHEKLSSASSGYYILVLIVQYIASDQGNDNGTYSLRPIKYSKQRHTDEDVKTAWFQLLSSCVNSNSTLTENTKSIKIFRDYYVRCCWFVSDFDFGF